MSRELFLFFLTCVAPMVCHAVVVAF